MAATQTTLSRPALKLIVGSPSQAADAVLADLIGQHQAVCDEIARAGARVDPSSDDYDPSLWPHFGDLARAEEVARREVIAHPVDTLSDFRVKAEYLLDLLNSDAKTGSWLDATDTWKLLMSVVGPHRQPVEH